MLKIGVIDTSDQRGGVRTFITHFYRALYESGYHVELLDLANTPLDVLNGFDILHFSNFDYSINTWKIFFIRHPKKVLTIHGWVIKENSTYLKDTRNPLRYRLGALFRILLFKMLIHFFDSITCPTSRTAHENGLTNAYIIPNGIFPNDYSPITTLNVNSNPKKFQLISYFSIGGLKSESVGRIVDVVDKLKTRLGTDYDLVSLIFGTQDIEIRSSSVHFMGYTNDFLRYVAASDILLMGYSFQELGYTMLESGLMGIPIAKFTDAYALDDISDGETGLLAKDTDEMTEKVYRYLMNITELKPQYGQALRRYVYETRSWSVIMTKWSALFSYLTKSV